MSDEINWESCTDDEIKKFILENKIDVKNLDFENVNNATIHNPFYGENVIRMLVKLGFDINTRNDLGYTLLLVACIAGNLKMIEVLIELGADIKAKNKVNSSALMIAAKCCENPEIIQKLVDLGADINDADKCGRTVLMYAVKNDNPKIIQKLVELGADVKNTLSKCSFGDALKIERAIGSIVK